MTFLKVLRATNVGVRGPLPDFFGNFGNFLEYGVKKFIPRFVVRPCYQSKFSKMFIVIGKSVNPLHISFMLEESNFLTFP